MKIGSVEGVRYYEDKLNELGCIISKPWGLYNWIY